MDIHGCPNDLGRLASLAATNFVTHGAYSGLENVAEALLIVDDENLASFFPHVHVLPFPAEERKRRTIVRTTARSTGLDR